MSAAGVLVMLTGVLSAVGRLSMATLSDKLGRVLTVGLLAVLTAVCALMLMISSPVSFFIVILLVAFAYGGPSATLPAMTTDLCGPRYSGTNYGMAMMWLGVSSIVFNAVAQALFNATGSYNYGFIIAAVTGLITVGLMITYKILSERKKDKSEQL